MSTVVRYVKPGNTGDKLNLLLEAIRDPRVDQVVLFASPVAPSEGYSDYDGAENNLPIVAALASGTFVGNAPIQVVYDGSFLTAARVPRYLEVKRLLDEAEQSGKVYFVAQRAPFTSAMQVEKAAETMKSLGEPILLTPQSRSRYFSLLSNLTEKEFANL